MYVKVIDEILEDISPRYQIYTQKHHLSIKINQIQYKYLFVFPRV